MREHTNALRSLIGMSGRCSRLLLASRPAGFAWCRVVWIWRDDMDGRKVRPVAADITGEQPVPGDRGGCAEVEVWHGRALRTAAAPVAHERLPSGETGRGRQWLALVVGGRKQFIEFFDGLLTDRGLGVDERVDHHPPGVHGRCDMLTRPLGPLLVAGDDIEQHAGID